MLLTFLAYVLQRHSAILMPEFWQKKWQNLPRLLAAFLQKQQQLCSILQMQQLATAHPDVPKLALQISFIPQLLLTAWLQKQIPLYKKRIYCCLTAQLLLLAEVIIGLSFLFQ